MVSRRLSFAAATASAVLISTVVAAAISGPSPSTCAGDSLARHIAPLDQLKATGEIVTPSTSSESEPWQRVWTLSTPLSPGSFALNAVSWDGYTDRKSGEVQPFEIWFVEVLNSAEERLARSNRTTADIPDGVDEATWAGGLGTVTWAAGVATKVRVVHPEASPTQNSVVPICVSLTRLAAPAPAPEPGPAVVDATAPTTIGVDVRGVSVSQTPPAQVADPNSVQPRFTG